MNDRSDFCLAENRIGRQERGDSLRQRENAFDHSFRDSLRRDTAADRLRNLRNLRISDDIRSQIESRSEKLGQRETNFRRDDTRNDQISRGILREERLRQQRKIDEDRVRNERGEGARRRLDQRIRVDREDRFNRQLDKEIREHSEMKFIRRDRTPENNREEERIRVVRMDRRVRATNRNSQRIREDEIRENREDQRMTREDRMNRRVRVNRLDRKIRDDQANRDVREDRINQRIREDRIDGRIRENRIDERIREDRIDGRIREDKIDGRIREDRNDGRVHEDKVVGRVREHGADGRYRRDITTESVREDRFDGLVREGRSDWEAREDRLDRRLRENSVGERDRVGERAREDRVGERIREDRVGERIRENRVGERVREDRVGERAREDRVGERIREDRVGERAREESERRTREDSKERVLNERRYSLDNNNYNRISRSDERRRGFNSRERSSEQNLRSIEVQDKARQENKDSTLRQAREFNSYESRIEPQRENQRDHVRRNTAYIDGRDNELKKPFVFYSPQLTWNFCQTILVAAVVLQLIKYKNDLGELKRNRIATLDIYTESLLEIVDRFSHLLRLPNQQFVNYVLRMILRLYLRLLRPIFFPAVDSPLIGVNGVILQVDVLEKVQYFRDWAGKHAISSLLSSSSDELSSSESLMHSNSFLIMRTDLTTLAPLSTKNM
ncbi:Circumsporozoite protein [Pseudolycoriella hygida]|uniref:Circumsporozoite protein n=1 Tax=Pseudolycoriella hygida TaxID=35572 RepID=A0A9Q0NFK4_9DIPT|nr:Circumsporozoite protein [Pseudolycoriella hygida]